MTHKNRDQALEVWLRRPPFEVSAGEDAGCPDDETIAAWLDGGLSTDALNRVLAHASMCERCEAIAASVLRTEAAQPAAAFDETAVPWWRRWLAWGVPLTAAATAVVALAVWVRTPEVPSSRAAAPGTATNSSRSTAVGSAALSEAAAALADARSNNSDSVNSPLSKSSDSVAPQPQTARATGAPANSEARAAERRGQPDAEVAERKERFNAVALPTAPGNRLRDSVQSEPAQQGRALEAAKTIAPLEAAPPPLPPPQSPRQSDPAAAGAAPVASAAARGGTTVSLPAAAPAAPDSGSAGAAVTTRRSTATSALAGRAEAATSWTVLMSPTNRPLWRFRGREVERTIDGGATWSRVAGNATGVLSSGVSVSESVSWFAGERGTVVLVSAGRSTVVPFPQPVDLVSVHATTSLSAAVTTRDGRVFTTSDGGRTWRAP